MKPRKRLIESIKPLQHRRQRGQQEPVNNETLIDLFEHAVARYADKMTAAGGWVITLPHDTDVAAFDRITVGGVDYRVVGTQVGESWLSAVRAYCERIS